MTTTMVQKPDSSGVRATYAPRLTFYRANSKGTGTAAQFELRFNREGEQRYNCIFLEMAHQKTAAEQDNTQRKAATFDWANKVTSKLDFLDVAELLMVLQGEKEQAGSGKGGIYHASSGANTLISLTRSSEAPGFYLGLSKKNATGEQIFKGGILLSEAEAVGVRCVFQSALFFMAFGANVLNGAVRASPDACSH